MPKAAGIFYFVQMQKELLIKIGYTAKTHGLKGDLTLNMSDDAPELAIGDVVMVEKGSGLVPQFISALSGHSAKIIVKFEGVDSR